ncbi:TPA: colicin transporter [Mannheimia haemolytica]|nr:colicin transporter [Mannheimia haemolytica]
MSIKKVTLASLILLGLTACSSGGSGSSSNNVAKPNTKPQTTQQQTDKAAAEKAAKDKAAKEKAEAERLAAEKAAKEKAEAERLAAEKAAKEKAAKEKAEAERLAAEKAAKEKAEAERLAAEKAAKEKAEAERLAAEKAAKEKAEAERLAAEKAAKEKAEAERLAAEKAAKEKAEAERLAAEKEVDPIAIIKAKGIDDTNYGLKLGNSKETIEGKVTVRTQSYLYNQPYSVVTAQAVQRNGWENGNYIDKVDGTVTVKGLKTEKLPTEGTATYSGKAFNHDGAKGFNGGDLTYNVNFSKRTGSGRVEGEFGNLIVLEEGTINNTQISSTVHGNNPLNLSGKYTVEFFGKNAEEIAGEIQTKANLTGEVSNFGLAGTRGDIQK